MESKFEIFCVRQQLLVDDTRACFIYHGIDNEIIGNAHSNRTLMNFFCIDDISEHTSQPYPGKCREANREKDNMISHNTLPAVSLIRNKLVQYNELIVLYITGWI